MGRGSGTTATVSAPRRRAKAPAVQVDHATREDIPELINLKSEVALRTYGPDYGKEKAQEWISKNCDAKHFQYRIGRSGYQVLVARQGKQIVGLATMRQRGDRMDMSGLYVLKPGQGIGSQLLRQRQKLARELGCTSSRVSVFRSNENAKNFVTSKGYQPLGRGFREPVFDVMVDHYEQEL